MQSPNHSTNILRLFAYSSVFLQSLEGFKPPVIKREHV
jgi:hypothetical protein